MHPHISSCLLTAGQPLAAASAAAALHVQQNDRSLARRSAKSHQPAHLSQHRHCRLWRSQTPDTRRGECHLASLPARPSVAQDCGHQLARHSPARASRCVRARSKPCSRCAPTCAPHACGESADPVAWSVQPRVGTISLGPPPSRRTSHCPDLPPTAVYTHYRAKSEKSRYR